MRVTILTNTDNRGGLAQDADIIHGLLAAFLGEESVIVRRHYLTSEPSVADVNVFLEVLNPIHFSYARFNILIPNPEWFPDTWREYLPQLDVIWAKTHPGRELLEGMWGLMQRAAGLATPVRHIGWSSIDVPGHAAKKNFHKALMVAGRNTARPLQMVIDAWRDEDPELFVVWEPEFVTGITIREHPKIRYFQGRLEAKALTAARAECGVYIALSRAEGFGHAANEARAAGCLLVTNDYMEWFGGAAAGGGVFPCATVSETPAPVGGLGTYRDTSPAELHKALDAIAVLSFREKQAASAANRIAFVDDHKAFLDRAKDAIAPLKTVPGPGFTRTLPHAPKPWPKVSLITPTRDRVDFMRLSKYCFMTQDYPGAMEWIIYDDSEEAPCAGVVRDLPEVVYRMDDPSEDPGVPRTIAYKRNKCASWATGDIILSWDDDDFYPASSIRLRVEEMLYQKKRCVYSAIIPMYHITSFTSAMNVPPIGLPSRERVSEATLAFTRQFWRERGFPAGDAVGEGAGFLAGREAECGEINCVGVIVSLLHAFNTSSRALPEGAPRGNGQHWGWPEMVFELVCHLGDIMEEKKKAAGAGAGAVASWGTGAPAAPSGPAMPPGAAS